MTDQPTRRLTDPPSGLTGDRCPKCHGPQVHAQGGGYVTLMSDHDRNFLGMAPTTLCEAWVCSQCGYIEWYAKNPEQLGT